MGNIATLEISDLGKNYSRQNTNIRGSTENFADVLTDAGKQKTSFSEKNTKKEIIKESDNKSNLVSSDVSNKQEIKTNKNLTDKDKIDMKMTETKIKEKVLSDETTLNEESQQDSYEVYDKMMLQNNDNLEICENSIQDCEEFAENLQKLSDNIRENFKDMLDIDDDELDRVLQLMSVEVIQLLQPEIGQEVVLEVNDSKSISDVLVNEKMSQDMAEVMEFYNTGINEINSSISSEELTSILNEAIDRLENNKQSEDMSLITNTTEFSNKEQTVEIIINDTRDFEKMLSQTALQKSNIVDNDIPVKENIVFAENESLEDGVVTIKQNIKDNTKTIENLQDSIEIIENKSIKDETKIIENLQDSVEIIENKSIKDNINLQENVILDAEIAVEKNKTVINDTNLQKNESIQSEEKLQDGESSEANISDNFKTVENDSSEFLEDNGQNNMKKENKNQYSNYSKKQDGFENFDYRAGSLQKEDILNINMEPLAKEMVYVKQLRDIVSQVSERIKLDINTDSTKLEMQLNPENLGKMTLSVTQKDGTLTAHVTVENIVAKEALESGLQILKENLNEQGVKVNAIEVTIANSDLNNNGEQSNSSYANERDNNKKNNKKIKLENDDFVQSIAENNGQIMMNGVLQNTSSVSYTA